MSNFSIDLSTDTNRCRTIRRIKTLDELHQVTYALHRGNRVSRSLECIGEYINKAADVFDRLNDDDDVDDDDDFLVTAQLTVELLYSWVSELSFRASDDNNAPLVENLGNLIVFGIVARYGAIASSPDKPRSFVRWVKFNCEKQNLRGKIGDPMEILKRHFSFFRSSSSSVAADSVCRCHLMRD